MIDGLRVSSNLTTLIGAETRSMDGANANSRAASTALEQKEKQDEEWALQVGVGPWSQTVT